MGVVKGYPTTKSPSTEARQVTTTDKSGDKVLLDVAVGAGTVALAGASLAWSVTTVDITDVATSIVLTPLTDRQGVSVFNLSAVDTLYIGPTSAVTADRVLGTTSGYEIPPEGEWHIGIEDTIVIYAICEAGKTCRVKILEAG